jgi:DNA (cytosine-5)-methyltransferase 1
MGFPDGYTEDFSDHQRYRMLGNSMPVPVVQWIGKRILESEPQS